MLRLIDLRGSLLADYRGVVPRAEVDLDAAVETVRPICEAVRTGGVEAIRELSLRFDGVAPEQPRVPPEAITRALRELDPAVRAGLEESVARLRRTCEAEL
jgi:histidinol dehydrogenase